ncbi:hypothetical protein ES708_33644 [subsurface metagenome]
MKPAKAIEILKDAAHFDFPADSSDFMEATKLGIEALKRIQNARNIGYSVPASLLPGETES